MDKNTETKKNIKYTKYVLTSFVFLIFIIAVINIQNGTKTNVESNLDVKSIAQCLTDKGAIMAGTEWCPHCKDQKNMFGQYFDLIKFIDCDKNTQKCQELGVEGYPTWIINDQKYPGTRPINDLKKLAGC